MAMLLHQHVDPDRSLALAALGPVAFGHHPDMYSHV